MLLIGTRARRRALAVVCGMLVLAACSASPSPSSSPTSPGTVTLVTYDSYAISDKVLQEFTDQTGLKVEVLKGGDAVEVVNRALLTEGNPEGDVLFGVDNNVLSRTITAGLFVPHQPAGAQDIPTQYVLDKEYRVTPIDVGDVCVNDDKEYFAAHHVKPPRTLADLLKPQYRGLLVVEDPSTSTPGLAFLLASVAEFGPDGFADYWRKLKANDVLVERSWDAAYGQQFSGGSGSGDRPLVVSYASSPPYEAMDAPKGKAPTGVLADTCYRQIEFAGLLANAPNPAGGQKLIDFMITKTYQQDLPMQNFVYPVVPGVKLPKIFTDNAQVVDQPLSIPPEEVAANRDSWVSTWTDIMQH